jgi:hypothetical protein
MCSHFSLLPPAKEIVLLFEKMARQNLAIPCIQKSELTPP